MTTGSPTTLLIIDGLSEQTVTHAVRESADGMVVVLDIHPEAEDTALPHGWVRLRVQELLEPERFRDDFLEFLDHWPNQPLSGGKSFDDLFRRSDGYSLWWTGCGTQRTVQDPAYRHLQAVWIADRAMRQVEPDRVVIGVDASALLLSLQSMCGAGKTVCKVLAETNRPKAKPWAGQWRWLMATVCWQLLFPVVVAVRAISAWLLARPCVDDSDKQSPAVVFASPLFRWFQIDNGQVRLSYWRNVCRVLSAEAPSLRQRFLVHVGKSFGGFRVRWGCYHTAWSLFRGFQGALPVPGRYPAWRDYFGSLPRQLLCLWRFARLERQPAMRELFQFAGADVSSLYVPMLRQSVGRMIQWDQQLGALTRVLRTAGNVRAMLVSCEMNAYGVLQIAAARRLGIPTIGVQHAPIGPMYLDYTIPAGQVQGAPLADYFAAFSEYATEIACRHGSFPADRVWVVGATRFDRLASEPPDPRAARGRLELPNDEQVILLATLAYPWFERVVRAALGVLKNRTDCLICVKTHPSDKKVEKYAEIARQLRVENIRFFEGHFEDLLAGCDVVITGSSTTVVLEAVLMGRAAICADFNGEPEWYPYSAEGGVVRATSETELDAAIRQALTKHGIDKIAERRREFLQRHVGPAARGNAAETLAHKALEVVCRVSTPSSAGDDGRHLQEAYR